MLRYLIIFLLIACGATSSTMAGPFTWLRTAGSAKTADRALEDAMGVLNKGKSSLAIKHFRRISLKWPESPEAVMALQRMAKLQQSRDILDAFDTYQILIDRHAGKFNFEETLKEQMKIAAKVQQRKSGASRFIPGLHNGKKAIPLYEAIVKNAPAWEKSGEAQYLIGVIHQSEREYEAAIAAYRTVIEGYPDSAFLERASFFQTESFYKLASKRLTQRELDTAWVYVNRFLEKYPESDFTEKAIQYKKSLYEKMAQKSWDVARYYDKTVKKPQAALIAYRQFAARYPGAKQSKEAKLRIQQLSQASTN